MLLAVAVILGIVLLQQFDSGIDTGRVSTDAPVGTGAVTTTTRRATLTTLATTTSTAARARPKAEVPVLVANGGGVRGAGGATTSALRAAGYTSALPPVDATVAVDKTSIQFADGFEAEAREVAQALAQPVSIVTRLSTSAPVADVGDAKVLVILGIDSAASSTTSAPGASTTSTTRR